MNILWISNTIFPAPSEYYSFKRPISGGWMYSLAEQLSKEFNIKLAVATIYNGSDFKEIIIEDVIYYLIPSKSNLKYNKDLEKFWQLISNKFCPDIVHIHGTEYTHGLACMRALPNLIYIISIQGLISVIFRYYTAGLSNFDVYRNITFRDIFKADNILQAKQNFLSRGNLEIEYLSRTKHVIGRTNWDKIHVQSINKNVKYHLCNESLRHRFYTSKKWNLNNCVKHSIFLSQGNYPLKGLHQVIKAIIPLVSKYPNVQIRVGGTNIIAKNTIVEKLKFTGYGNYIYKLLKKNNLINNINFLGMLSEEDMIREYQNCNIFICPSSIENSPNSLGEAQLIGVPTISAYVGGIPDMVIDNYSGLLYRYEEIEILTHHIDILFTDNDLANKLSSNGIKVATTRHDAKSNLTQLLLIYNEINLG